MMLRCPDGVTRYCVGVAKQAGGTPTAITGRTSKKGDYSVKLHVHLSPAQLTRLRRTGRVKITVVFVEQMPNGRLRTTRRVITVK